MPRGTRKTQPVDNSTTDPPQQDAVPAANNKKKEQLAKDVAVAVTNVVNTAPIPAPPIVQRKRELGTHRTHQGVLMQCILL